ncbi:PAP2 family protein [Carboxylicivirga sp. A043]|uniref:PAP2 family protein n=1 Tax=Carboxylicivirga litoralis TaxID=2816963 RepID=UPI0021CB788B|nr:PAP2 family protein [Carboxylicivirga sp. A043]MCU4155278.1 PAP2 family protein [Carboxylicivirga sp. A043]
MQIVSKVLSTVFHPMLIPTLGLFLIFNMGGHFTYLPIDHQRVVYLIVFLSTCVLPLTLMPLFMLLGVIKTVYMKERRERIIPTVFTGFFYLLGFFLLNRIPVVPSFIKGFMLATIIAISIALAITFFWKISMHMIGIGGLTGAILALSLRFGIDAWMIFTVVLLISGLLGSSRLFLNAHTPAQVHTGYLLGTVVVFFGVLL